MNAPRLLPARALLPAKAFDSAKGRLAAVLTAAERASLAEAMLRDVIAAAQGAEHLNGISLLGGKDARRLARETGTDWLDDGGEPDLNTALARAANGLARRGAGALLVLPGDLPTVQSHDIDALLACHEQGLTISPARSDGGTNALVISPADALRLCFGPDSARRHMVAALGAGLPAQKVALTAFARDIDGPADLHWLCAQRCGDHTSRWLKSHNVDRRLGNSGPTALQA